MSERLAIRDAERPNTGLAVRPPQPRTSGRETGYASARRRALFLLQEIARLTMVGIAAVFVARPLLTPRWFGGEDLLWYLQQLQDYLIQLHHGTLPPMVGQTEFYWVGVPHVRTLLYLYVGSFIDWVWRSSLAPLDVLYLTMACAFLAGAYVMYGVLVALNSKQRWIATAFAIQYAACPAGLVQAMVMHMVPTILALPLVPIVFYAALRFIRRQDATAGVLLAVGLFLMMITHIWMTLWVILFIGIPLIYRIVTTPHRVRTVLLLGLSGVLLAVMSLYYVIAVFQTNYFETTSSEANPTAFHLLFGQSLYESISAYERSILSNQLFPLTTVGGSSSQLGWSLWAMLVLGLLALIKGRRSIETGTAIVTSIIVILYLFPLTFVSNVLYRALPSIFEIGNNWPDQRLYIPLATVVSIAGFAGIRDLELSVGTLKRSVMFLVLASACGWSLSQANRVDDFVFTQMLTSEGSASVQLPENASLNGSSVSASGTGYQPPSGYSGSAKDLLDPRLDDGLADAAGAQVFSNLTWLTDGPGATASQRLEFAAARDVLDSDHVWRHSGRLPGGVETLGAIRIEPLKRYLLSFPVRLQQARAEILLNGGSIHGVSRLGPEITPGVTHWEASLWTSASDPVDVVVTGSVSCITAGADCSTELGPFAVQEYSGVELPVDVLSLLPYRAQIRGNSAAYLETHREFVPGYVATVNGVPVAPGRSLRGRLMVSLPPGDATVELDYPGTPLTVISRWVSAATVSIAVAFLLGRALPIRWTTIALVGPLQWRRHQHDRSSRER